MIILKQFLHNAPTNSVEVTWVERTVAPDTVIAEGVETTPAIPARTEPGAVTDVGIKCHSYADVQMQMLRDDALALGTPLDEYEDMIALVESKIVPYVPPPTPVPQSVSMRQARLALLGAGLLDDVEAAVAQADRAVQIEWEFSGELRRDWPTLILLAGALGLSDTQLDTLFTQAATL